MKFLFLASCLAVLASQAVLAQDDSVLIQVHETPKAYSLNVPVSKIEILIPKGSLKAKVLKGTSDNPRYFLFNDDSNATVVSGWFESADGFKGIPKFWEEETASWKKNGLPQPHDVAFEKIGSWDVIVYELQVPEVTNSNIRAHLVRSGTWIDIHLSVTSSKPAAENRTYLRKLLQGIVITERK